jgi:hypothetical protein
MERTKRSMLIALASMCFIACAILGVRFIADGYGGTLYWKGDEAYFFTSDSHRGYQVSYLAFPFELLAQNFFWAPLPSEQWVLPGNPDHPIQRGTLPRSLRWAECSGCEFSDTIR